jgi:hypothetical protein
MRIEDNDMQTKLDIRALVKERDTALARIRAIDELLRLCKDVAGIDAVVTPLPRIIKTHVGDGSVKQRRPRTPKSGASPVSEVLQACRLVLTDVTKPMKRATLLHSIEELGVCLAGQDKARYLGNLLWRHPEEFVNVPRKGYLLKSKGNVSGGPRLPTIPFVDPIAEAA